MNKPRPIKNSKGQVAGYKQEVKWRGQRYYFTRRTVAAAERCWANAIADLEAGVHPYDRYEHEKPEPTEIAKPITFGEWLEAWHPKRRLSPQANYNQRTYLDAHIIPSLGHLPMTETGFTRAHIQEWVWGLQDEYMPRYVHTLLGVVRLALLDAIDEPSIPLNATPVVRIRMEPPDPTGRKALTPEQVAAIASRCGIHETLVWSLPFAGTRIGELLKRDVPDWSPFNGITIVGRPIKLPVEEDRPRKRKKGARKGKAAKTAAGARVIQLCPSHGAMIRDYLGGRESGPLFVGRDGRSRPTYSTVRLTIVNAVVAARKAKIDVPEGVTPHWFRVTGRTWLAEDGIPRVARDERAGHSTPGMEGVYERATPAMRKAILDSLEIRWKQAMSAPERLRKTA